jgi:hypothetical protein
MVNQRKDQTVSPTHVELIPPDVFIRIVTQCPIRRLPKRTRQTALLQYTGVEPVAFWMLEYLLDERKGVCICHMTIRLYNLGYLLAIRDGPVMKFLDNVRGDIIAERYKG